MTLSHRLRRCLALSALLPCAVASAGSATVPSLQQAQAAMDRMFDQAVADRPASDSSRLVAETFRPRLQTLDSCAPAEAGDAVDCIATASAGIESRPQLLRLALVDGVWSLPDQRNVPVPAPPRERVQALLRERIAGQAQQQADPALRARFEQAASTLQVQEVRNCEVASDRAAIECTVRAGDGSEHGEQSMAFVRVDGQWQNAPAD
ncbi:hypothetical protein [Stenotrophomonas indicatrix]|uniref:hypothetical protein n=1 Tax=Stenotrophomonas indicatrix TaxID=2045451 RepID=UPI0020065611|nr:hypothetical protein [Stenotrophomonas indicatrix]MCK6230412.1 hypothetical protein [Stenotrophomonas indicatrix]